VKRQVDLPERTAADALLQDILIREYDRMRLEIKMVMFFVVHGFSST